MKKKLINRMIIVSWILLFCCFIFKIFSNDLFEIAISNENFINFTTYIDSNFLITTLIYLPYTMIGNTLLVLAIIGNKIVFKNLKYKHIVLIVIGSVFVEYIIKMLILYFLPTLYTYIGFVLDTSIIVFLPDIFNRDILCCINGFLINLGIQSSSLLIRNFGIKIILYDSLTNMILAIDVLLMYLIYFLYSVSKKEVNNADS